MLSLLGLRSVALRQDEQHRVEAQVDAKGRVLCCVTASANYGTRDAKFQKDAFEMHKIMTSIGAYGGVETFNASRYEKHCYEALQLEKCVHVSLFTFTAGTQYPKSWLIEQIDSFLHSYRFHSEDYGYLSFNAPECPPALKAQEDTKRCSKDFQHFIRMLELWKQALQDSKDVKKNAGVKGFIFGSREKGKAAKADLAHVKEELEALW